MANRFSGKTILITGGNSGIGFTTAQRIISEGGHVIITGRNSETLAQAQKDLGLNCDAIQSDVGQLAQIDDLMSQIQNKYKKIDGVFANAGVGQFATIDQVTEADFDHLFNTNVKGVYFTLQKVIPLLKPGSSVVLNASVAGSKGGAIASVYAATKAAVRSMARTFSSTYLMEGIRFNVVSPGPIDTPIWKNVSDKSRKNIVEANPMKRYGSCDEVAAAVAFLLSSESSYTAGSELFVDGGFTQL